MWHAPTVAGFSAELYLRLIGEQMLLDRGDQNRGPHRPPIAEAAGALVGIGALAAAEAESVLDDYSLAATLRSDPQFHRRTIVGSSRGPEHGAGQPLPARRVVPCALTIEQPQATVNVRWVSLSENTTSVAVTWCPDPSRPFMGGRPPQATLTDDRGTAVTADFSGGGTTDGMLGRLTSARPLAPDTAWIDLDGTRLELIGEASRSETSVQHLPAQDPAHRYLWQRIAMPNEVHRDSPESIEPAIDALVAAGRLSAEDPALDHMRTVLAALQQRVPGAPAGWTSGVGATPDPWRSLLARRGRADGPTGSIVLGAVTPTFDGFSVAVLNLRSDAREFAIEVEVAPGLDHRMPFDWSIQPRQLAWWARDDCGNHYLGHRGNWSTGESYGHGLIGFEPALDPGATRLDLLPTAERTRAVIGVPLRWAPEPWGAP